MTCARKVSEPHQRAGATAVGACQPCAATAHPDLDVECLTRVSAGDRDQTSPLWKMGDRGAFTADLSDALSAAKPTSSCTPSRTCRSSCRRHAHRRRAAARRPTRRPAGAQPVAARPAALKHALVVAAPRLAAQETLPPLLPWPVRAVRHCRCAATSRRASASSSRATHTAWSSRRPRSIGCSVSARHSIAKPATLRGYLDQLRWMVMPMREFPWAPAQGAIAIEIADRAPISRSCSRRSSARRRRRRSATSGKYSPITAAAAIRRLAPPSSTSRMAG